MLILEIKKHGCKTSFDHETVVKHAAILLQWPQLELQLRCVTFLASVGSAESLRCVYGGE